MGGDGWHTEEDLKPPLLAAEAAGYLVFDGPNEFGEPCVALASALVFKTDGKPDFCPSFVIPKKMVLSVEVV
jgi:hypothetical protein